MSVHVTSWAWKQPVRDSSEKLVLLKLADNANDQGVCWPSQDVLAEECGLSVRTVKTKVAALAEQGLIEVRRRGRRQSNVYTFTEFMGGKSRTSLESDVQLVALPKEPSQDHVVVPNGTPTQARLEELWDACELHVQTAPTAKSPRSAYAKLVREMLAAGWTPADVKTRAAAYKRHPTLGGTMLTLAALAKWGETFPDERTRRSGVFAPPQREPEPEGPWAPPPQWPILKDMPA